MYCIVKGRAKVTVYEMKECDCCGHINEHEMDDVREITVLLDVDDQSEEMITGYLECHLENTTKPGVRILLRKWIEPPVIEELYPDLVNRIIGAPVLFDVKPVNNIQPVYARLAKKMGMDKYCKSLCAVEVM